MFIRGQKTLSNLTCKVAKYGIELDAQGNINPCCYAKPLVSLNDMTLDQAWNSKERLQLLSNLENGIQDPHCLSCWDEEKAGRQSKRMRENERLVNYTGDAESPYLVDIKPWNTCNLRCRICGPDNSSSWVNEFSIVENKKYDGFDQKYYLAENSNFWDTMENWLVHAEYIDFYGGEPLLIKKPWKLLEKNAVSGRSKEQELQFNTNTTIPLSETQLQTLLQFKKINIALSIDGIEEQFEYLRYPGKWDTTLKNIDDYIEYGIKYENINVSFCCTVSIHNLWYVVEFDQYIKGRYGNDTKIWYNILFGPDCMRITNIPENVKLLVKNKINSSSSDFLVNSIIDFMEMEPYKQGSLEIFKQTTLKYDYHRNQNFTQTFPEWSSILGI